MALPVPEPISIEQSAAHPQRWFPAEARPRILTLVESPAPPASTVDLRKFPKVDLEFDLGPTALELEESTSVAPNRWLMARVMNSLRPILEQRQREATKRQAVHGGFNARTNARHAAARVEEAQGALYIDTAKGTADWGLRPWGFQTTRLQPLDTRTTELFRTRHIHNLFLPLMQRMMHACSTTPRVHMPEYPKEALTSRQT